MSHVKLHVHVYGKTINQQPLVNHQILGDIIWPRGVTRHWQPQCQCLRKSYVFTPSKFQITVGFEDNQDKISFICNIKMIGPLL